MTSLVTLIKSSTETLTKAGINDPALDARILIGHALNLDRAQLITHKDHTLTLKETEKINALIERRAKREPVGRILGCREFWGLPFKLNEATLEPRPDSETLIETALKRSSHPKPKRILDLGTGTGCLLLALLSEWREATGLGIDLSPKAVKQAASNAQNLKLNARAKFQIGHWLDNIDEKFDLIISNPPYISPEEIQTLDPEVQKHDPMKALNGGKEGLEPYTYLIPRLPAFMNKNSIVLFEIGATQKVAVEELLKQEGFKDILTVKDLAGQDRCVSGWF